MFGRLQTSAFSYTWLVFILVCFICWFVSLIPELDSVLKLLIFIFGYSTMWTYVFTYCFNIFSHVILFVIYILLILRRMLVFVLDFLANNNIITSRTILICRALCLFLSFWMLVFLGSTIVLLYNQGQASDVVQIEAVKKKGANNCVCIYMCLHD